ncbi:MAG: peptidoglycan-binding protein LysM [Arenicella sp.]|nr:peptidoglycan-binding protein LysM [Arenicella sp.]
MGLFDFAADIGQKVFGIGDADAAEKIKEKIESNNPGVSDLSVSLDGDVCSIGGTCDSAMAREKVVLMAGNMKGVGSVNVDNLKGGVIPTATADSAEADSEAAAETEYYTIESGDTLWGIAAKFLGNGSKYTEIFEANREVIEDPDKIFVGQKIRIPR